MLNPVGMVQQGVAKTKNDMFRIATLSDEFVVVTSRDKVAEYLKQPDSVLNMQDGANDVSSVSDWISDIPSNTKPATTDRIHHGIRGGPSNVPQYRRSEAGHPEDPTVHITYGKRSPCRF